MNKALRKELSEEAVAVKLANYVLDKEFDPDSDICILARQFLRKRETIRSVVAAVGGHVFVPSDAIAKGNDPTATLIVSHNNAQHGYDVLLQYEKAPAAH